MDKGRQFFLAIVVFVMIAFVILILIKNFWSMTVFLVLDFVALLRVLYEIFRPPERKKRKKVCQADMVAELEMNMDGTVRANMVPVKKKVRKKKET